jgi:hypothetical protein
MAASCSGIYIIIWRDWCQVLGPSSRIAWEGQVAKGNCTRLRLWPEVGSVAGIWQCLLQPVDGERKRRDGQVLLKWTAEVSSSAAGMHCWARWAWGETVSFVARCLVIALGAADKRILTLVLLLTIIALFSLKSVHVALDMFWQPFSSVASFADLLCGLLFSWSGLKVGIGGYFMNECWWKAIIMWQISVLLSRPHMATIFLKFQIKTHGSIKRFSPQ